MSNISKIGIIGIIGALDTEIEYYLSELKSAVKDEHSGFMFYSGRLVGKPVVLVKSGVGKVNASACAQILIDSFNVSAIIFTGVSGGLNPSLEIKDIVISTDSIQHDVDATKLGFKPGEIPYSKQHIFPASKELSDHAHLTAKKLGLNAIKGRMLSGDQFISDRDKSAGLRTCFSGDCVDMESAAIAQICHLNNIPHVIIRSISDRADHSAPVDFPEFSKEASKNSFLLVKSMVSTLGHAGGGILPVKKLKKSGTNAVALAKSIKSKIRTVPDWPKKGIMFRDVTTLLKDGEAFRYVVDQLCERYSNADIDVVVGIESRGFILGSVLANKLGVGFVPIRKPNKLPAEKIWVEYALEYGTDKIEIHLDAIEKGQRVLLVDDLIATGGTALAACQLVNKLGGKIIECCFLVDLPDLKGRAKLEAAGYKVFALVDFEGE